MLQYLSEIRVTLELLLVTLELLLTIGSLWWAIRTFVISSASRDHLMREEDEAHSHQGGMEKSVKKMEDTLKKITGKIIPSQEEVMVQLVKQIENMEKSIKKSNLPEKVKLYKEVQQFYTEQPDSRYFRATNYKPGVE